MNEHPLHKYVGKIFEDHKRRWWELFYEEGNGYWMVSAERKDRVEFQVETVEDLGGYKLLTWAT